MSEMECLTPTHIAGDRYSGSGKASEGIMENTITVTIGTGVYIPSRIGGQPDAWQEPVSSVRVNGQPRIVIDGERSELVLSTGRVNVDCDVPADVRGDHAATVAWWEREITRQERQALEGRQRSKPS